MSKERQIALGLLGSVLFAGVNLGVTFLQFRLIVLYLAPETAGLWMLFLSMIGYLIILDMGLSPTLGREVSFALGNVLLSEEERDHRVAQLIHSGQRALLVLSLLVIAVGSTVGCLYLHTVSSPSTLHQAQLAWAILTVGAAFNLIGEIWFAALYGMGRVASEKIIRCVGQILWLILTVTAIFLHFGLVGLAVAWLIQGVIVRFLAKHFFHKQCKMLSTSVSFDMDLVRSLIGPSMKYAATALGGVLILQTDNIIIASVMGTAQIPGYQAVSKLVTTLMSLAMMLVVTTTPFISQAYSQGQMDEIKRLLYRNLRVSLSVLVICGALVAGFADRIISVWLGPHQFVGFGVVWVLLAVMILEAHHVAMATATMATGKIVFVVPALLAGVLNIGFSVFLAHKLGLFGVALGTMCAQVLTNNWYVPFYTMRHFGIKIREHAAEVFAPIAKLILAVSITSGICRLATSSVRDIFSLIIAGCSIVIIGSFVFYFSLLSANEREVLTSSLARFRWIGTSASQINR